jgi:hypothetical protein
LVRPIHLLPSLDDGKHGSVGGRLSSPIDRRWEIRFKGFRRFKKVQEVQKVQEVLSYELRAGVFP